MGPRTSCCGVTGCVMKVRARLVIPTVRFDSLEPGALFAQDANEAARVYVKPASAAGEFDMVECSNLDGDSCPVRLGQNVYPVDPAQLYKWEGE